MTARFDKAFVSNLLSPRRCQRVGVGGAIVAAICCFTPVLVVALGAVGLSAWLGWLDYVLLPLLVVFLLVAGYGFYAQRKASTAANDAGRQTIE